MLKVTLNESNLVVHNFWGNTLVDTANFIHNQLYHQGNQKKNKNKNKIKNPL